VVTLSLSVLAAILGIFDGVLLLLVIVSLLESEKTETIGRN